MTSGVDISENAAAIAVVVGSPAILTGSNINSIPIVVDTTSINATILPATP